MPKEIFRKTGKENGRTEKQLMIINWQGCRERMEHMAVMTITADNFKAEVLEAKQPVLIDFWAAWCGPCKMMSPVIDQIAEENSNIKVGKINIDEQQQLAMQYGIMSIPTVALFENGEVKQTSVGAVPKAELEKLFK